MDKGDSVPRPVKSTEHTIAFATTHAKAGWRDVLATQKNAVADSWDRLTQDPQSIDAKCHPLKADLASITRGGRSYDQWQYELAGGARIWFYVDAKTVYLVKVYTKHPNQTK